MHWGTLPGHNPRQRRRQKGKHRARNRAHFLSILLNIFCGGTHGDRCTPRTVNRSAGDNTQRGKQNKNPDAVPPWTSRDAFQRACGTLLAITPAAADTTHKHDTTAGPAVSTHTYRNHDVHRQGVWRWRRVGERRGHTVTWSGAFQAEHLNTVGRWCRRRLLGGEALALYTVQSTSANLTDLAHSHRRYCRGPWRVRQQRKLAEVLSDVPPDDFLCTLCTATHAPSTQAKPYDHNPAPRTQFSRVT